MSFLAFFFGEIEESEVGMISMFLVDLKRVLEQEVCYLKLSFDQNTREDILIGIVSRNNQPMLKRMCIGFKDQRIFLDAVKDLQNSHRMNVKISATRLWSGSDRKLVGLVVYWVQEVDGMPKEKNITFPINDI
jgi:hypothetical protein